MKRLGGSQAVVFRMVCASLAFLLLSARPLSGQGVPGGAEPSADESETEVVELNPVLVIGTREAARLATGSAYVIEPADLRLFEFSNIHSIVRTVPGVYVREEDGLGTFPRIGIRASSSGRSDRISIMEDGIPAAMAPYANTSAYYFPAAARMSGVEILKGPEVLRYGPQTTSGAINLLSTPIPDEFEGFVNVEMGDWGSRRIHTWAGGEVGQFGVLAETFQNSTDGFHQIDRSNRTAGNDIADYMLKLRWASPSDAAIRQRLDLKLFKGDEYADVSYLGLTDADFRANPDRRYGLSELERMNRGRASVSLQHQITLASRFTFITTGYHADTYRDYTRLNQVNGIGIAANGITSRINNNGPDAALLQGILDGTAATTHANGVRYGNNFQTFIARGLQIEGRATLVTGGIDHELIVGARRHEDTARNTAERNNLVYDQVNGGLSFRTDSEATPNEGFANATALWVADRIRFGGLTLIPLLRHEDVESRNNVADPASARNSLTKTTLGLGTNYQLNAQWAVLLGVHQGFAPPGSNAIEGSKGEESTNFEGGARLRTARLDLDVVGFYTDYSNALRNCLVAAPCTDGSTDGTQQEGAKTVYGLETGLSTEVFSSAEVTVPLSISYTYTDGEYTRAADAASGVREGDVLDYTPKHVGTLTLGLAHDSGVEFATALSYLGGTCTTTTCGRSDVDSRFLETEALFTVDLSASYDFTSSVGVYGRLENLFDQRKITHRGADGARGNPGRHLGAGLRLSF